MDRRIIAQLYDSIDNILGIGPGEEPSANDISTDEAPSESKFVVLIAATNK
jgi:hypothetical protein